MRNVFPLLLLSFLSVLAGCSPTTDITRTSTENVAQRTGYLVLRTEPQGDLLHVVVRVNALSAARNVAEDVVIKKRIATGFNRMQVDVLAPKEGADAKPAATMKWSAKNGFSYSEIH